MCWGNRAALFSAVSPATGVLVFTSMHHLSLLQRLARRYPDELVRSQLADVHRVAFHLSLLPPQVGQVCDLGGGVGLFSVACASLGWQAVLIDDCRDGVNLSFGDKALALHADCGVTALKQNVLASDLDFPPASFDVVTAFDAMEHWHHSPKGLFRRVGRWLKPGGRFILGVPNCVNLRKRITVPLGIGTWSAMAEWYEAAEFRGHVREPDVADLRYIARDMALRNIRIIGRNWLGYASSSSLIRLFTYGTDFLLRRWPSLCSDIYLIGETPAS